jgi:hypothetical protein
MKLADALRDAARYQWLRAGNAYRPEEEYIDGGEELDQLCDIAMLNIAEDIAVEAQIHRELGTIFPTNEGRDRLERIYQELRTLAMEHKVAIVINGRIY